MVDNEVLLSSIFFSLINFDVSSKWEIAISRYVIA